MPRNPCKYWENGVCNTNWYRFKSLVESNVANQIYKPNTLISNTQLLKDEIQYLNRGVPITSFTSAADTRRVKLEDLNAMLMRRKHKDTGEIKINDCLYLKKHGSGMWKIITK
jgi:hypothetical protein